MWNSCIRQQQKKIFCLTKWELRCLRCFSFTGADCKQARREPVWLEACLGKMGNFQDNQKWSWSNLFNSLPISIPNMSCPQISDVEITESNIAWIKNYFWSLNQLHLTSVSSATSVRSSIQKDVANTLLLIHPFSSNHQLLLLLSFIYFILGKKHIYIYKKIHTLARQMVKVPFLSLPLVIPIPHYLKVIQISWKSVRKIQVEHTNLRYFLQR